MDSARSRLWGGLAAIGLLVSAWYFCRPIRYPEITSEGNDFAFALVSILNRNDAEGLAKFRAMLDRHDLTETDRRILDKIVNLAGDGNWQRAQRESRRLLQHQVRAAR